MTNCLVSELPTVEKDYVNDNEEDIYVSFAAKEREAYVAEVFEYLKSQNYKYFGTRGEQKNTLAGVFTTYYFAPADELESFLIEGDYIFVFSDGAVDENGDVEFNILIIYDVSTNTLEYGNKKFTYNTQISLRQGSEAPLGGFYVLKDYSISYESERTAELLMDGYAPTKAKPGGTVVLRTGTIMDADLAFYANGVKLTQTHADSDYWEYVFTMPDEDVVITHEFSGDGPAPTNHFLRNQAGCQWLNEITAEDIAEIKIISEYVGVAPGNLKTIQASTDKAVIARIFEDYYWLDTAPIPEQNGQIAGGSAITVKFILKDGTEKALYINNGNYLDANGDYFELLYVPKFEDGDNAAKAYGFITYIGTGTVYDKENNPVCEIPIDELEFVESDGCVDAVVTGYYYTVETEFGTLWFDYSNDLFYLQFDEGEDNYREYYQLVGKNLDELIAEHSPATE